MAFRSLKAGWSGPFRLLLLRCSNLRPGPWARRGLPALWACLILAFHCSAQEEASFEFLLPEEKSYLLIGDSLAERSDGFYLEELSPFPLRLTLRAVDGYDYRDWYVRMDQAFAGADAPDEIITVLGSNDAARFSEEEFLQNLNGFHNALRERSSARIIYSLVPRTRYEPVQGRILINNAILANHVPEGSLLVDLDSVFENHLDSGAVPLYPGDDPIHPNGNGYRLLGQTILNRILQP